MRIEDCEQRVKLAEARERETRQNLEIAKARVAELCDRALSWGLRFSVGSEERRIAAWIVYGDADSYDAVEAAE